MEKRIRAMYFSGTGTTEKVVSAIAYKLWQVMNDPEHKAGGSGAKNAGIDYLKAENINFTPKTAREKKYSFDKNDIVVFGMPVIAGRVPNVLLGFLDTIEGNGAAAVPVVLYGNRNFDDALIELRNILKDRGFRPIAAGAFIGEHSFSDKLAAGRPDSKDMETAYGFAEKTAKKILDIAGMSGGDPDRMDMAMEALSPVRVDGVEPLRPYYKPRDRKGNHINILKVIPKVDEDKCSKCGICAEICPMGSIEKDAPGHVKGICIKCCGCVKKCPEKAMYFDDPGYIYHKEELEIEYAARKEPSLYL